MAHSSKTFFQIVIHLGRLLQQATDEELQPLGLHHGQGRTLVVLLHLGPMNQAELARSVDVKPATITNMLKPLIERDLILREPDPRNSRAFVIELSERGRRLAVQVQQTWDRVEAQLLEHFHLPDPAPLFLQLECWRDCMGGRVPDFNAEENRYV